MSTDVEKRTERPRDSQMSWVRQEGSRRALFDQRNYDPEMHAEELLDKSLSPEERRQFGNERREERVMEMITDIVRGTQMALKGTSMPKLYHEIVRHVKAKGTPDRIAWPIAVEAVAKGCLYGVSSLEDSKGEKVKLGKTARARYCKAYAEWKENHPGGSGIGARIGKG